MARETSENSTYLYRTSVQYRCKWILYYPGKEVPHAAAY